VKKIPKNLLPAATIATLAVTMGHVIAPIESLYIQHLNHNGFVISSIFAFGAILSTVLSLWFGHLADKGFRHRLVFLGLGTAIIYPFLYANVINALQYAGVKFFWAIAAVSTGPLLLGYIQNSLNGEKSKGKWFGYYYAAGSIVGALAHFIGGYMGQHFGLKSDYILIGFLAIFNFTIALVFLKPMLIKVTNEHSNKKIGLGIGFFFSKPSLLFYLILNMAVDLNFSVKYFLWPLIIVGISHNITYSGSIFATMGITAFLVLSTSHLWADRYSPYFILIVSVSLLFISGLFISLNSSITVIWVAAAIFAVGESVAGPPQGILLTENIDEDLRGRILAIDHSIDNLSYTPSLLLAGLLLTVFSAQKVFLLYVLISLISLILGIYVYRSKIILKQI
jgi:MFS family permease